jgi:hypothetical protein
VTALATPLVAVRRWEWLFVGLLAAFPAVLIAAFGPSGGDVPAHLYRTFLVREHVYMWDNLWFAGHYPLVSYSLLYYPVAALIGNLTLVLGSVIASAVLFERICAREWGEAAVWPARAFAVLAAGPLYTGTYSYAAGVAALLATLWALQHGWTWTAVGFAAMTLGFSPLAFGFLVLVLAAALAARRPLGRRAAYFGLGLVLAVAVELVALHLFPSDGSYPFRAVELALVLVVAGIGLAVASRAPGGAVLAALFGLWLVACVVLFLVPEPVGENVTRLRSVVFPLMLLTALLARFRPRRLALAGLAIALVYNMYPYVATVPARIDSRASQETFWAPALDYLRAHATPDYRVEVVPTYDHWESYWLPREGFALARGWYRQLDLAENRVLYHDPLSRQGYHAWLKRMAVQFVLLPDVRLGKKGADREAQLLLAGVPGLELVFATPDWRVYRFREARPLLSGAGPAELTSFTHDRIAGRVDAPGRYRLAVQHMPYWQVKRGAICLTESSDGMTWLVARRAGRFVLETDGGPVSLVRSPLQHGGDCG